MPCFGRATLTVAGVAVLAIVAGCTENKVSQCNRLIEIANRAVTDVQSVTQSANPQDVNAMTQIANTADRAASEMQAVKLSDQQLLSYKDRFVSMYADTSKATRNLIAAVGNQDGSAAQQAYDALQTATNQEGTLVTEVNTYCGSGR
jgi:outer membrane PBP1 activator LpoA protein